MAKLKKIKWVLDSNDPEQGVKCISLVTEPAIESNFIALSKQKTKYVEFAKEGYKQVVAGLALIPDKEIPRIDPITEEKYIGYFDAPTIEAIRNKFFKELQLQNVTTQHSDSQPVNAYLIESFIISSDKQIEDLKAKGIEEACMGAWFTAYKIEDKETFQKVLDGELKGFSVELFADKITQSLKINNKKDNKLQNMKNSFLKTIKQLIEEFEKEIKLERAMVPALNIILDFEAEGSPVNQVLTDASGVETLQPVKDGTYELEDGRKLVVVNGLLDSIEAAPVVSASTEMASGSTDSGSSATVSASTETLASYPWDQCISDQTGRGYSQDSANKICGYIKSKNLSKEQLTEEILNELGVKPETALADSGATASPAGGDANKTIEQLVDLTQDGDYMIGVHVEAGVITDAAIQSNTYKELQFSTENFKKVIDEKEAFEAEKAELKREIESLKGQIRLPISKPIIKQQEERINKVDFNKLPNWKKAAIKAGINID